MHNESNLIRCGKNLQLLRNQKNISIEALAALSGIAAEVIERFESGNGSDIFVVDILQLAETLNVDIGAIFAAANSNQHE